MTGVSISTNSMRGVRLALFGPQHTQWTTESLRELQVALSQDAHLKFLADCLARLTCLWPLLQEHTCVAGFPGDEKLKEIEGFAGGGVIPDPQSLSNTHLAPLTVVSHVVDLLRISSCEDNKDNLPEFNAAQGFCIGFLSAAALASSNDWVDFERNVSNSVRLAACIGIVIDAEEAPRPYGDRATAVSVRWKTDIERTYLETCLDAFPNVSSSRQS